MAQHKDWCFTLFTTYWCEEDQWGETGPLAKIDMTHVRFLVYQLEEADDQLPELKTPHIQGYVEFKSRHRMLGAKHILGYEHVHLEPRKGTSWEAYVYCIKLMGRLCNVPFVSGTIPIQRLSEELRGCDSDEKLTAILNYLDENPTISKRELMRQIPSMYSRHFRLITEYMEERSREQSANIPINTSPEIYVYWGPSRTGKTTRVQRETNNFEKAFKLICDGHVLWFDGYNPTTDEDIVIEDFDGKSWTIIFFLHLLQNIPKTRFPKKCGHVWLGRVKRIFITSNINPILWYPDASEEHRNALMQRLMGPKSIVEQMDKIIRVGSIES